MANKIVKTRTIYDNYNPWDTYTDKDLTEVALECEWVANKDEITEDMLNEWRNEQMDIDFENVKDELTLFFKDKTVIFIGNLGLWDGTHGVKGKGDFWKLFWKAMKDCDYFRLYDENGHLYLTCSHHDGTNHFEIKVVTDKGHTVLPRYAEKVWGCPAREYVKPTKADFINKLSNEARSNYA